MYALYGHPRYIRFKQKYQQCDPYFQTIFPFLLTMAKYNFLKIQIFKIFHTADRTQFLTATRERKEEYAKLSLFKSKRPMLGSRTSLFFQFSSVNKTKNLVFLTDVNFKNEETLGMSIEMTLSITNKLLENLFSESKCFFHMSSWT